MSLNVINAFTKYASGGSYDLFLDETLLFGGLYFNFAVSPPDFLNINVVQWSGSTYTSASGAWVSKNNMPVAKYLAGSCGNAETNGAIFCGGSSSYNPDTRVTTTYGHLNNTASTKAVLPAAVSHCQAGGTLESAINCGGSTSGSGYYNGTTEYDLSGDSWTSKGNLSQGRYYAMAGGSGADHAICCGGWKSAGGVGASDVCESFDSSSWSTFSNTNFTAGSHNSSGDGSPDSAIRLAIYNGSGNVNLNQTWNGTAWTNNTGGNLPSAARTTSLCAGNQDNAIQASGGSTTVCQTWDSSAGAWVTQGVTNHPLSSTGGGGNSA